MEIKGRSKGQANDQRPRVLISFLSLRRGRRGEISEEEEREIVKHIRVDCAHPLIVGGRGSGDALERNFPSATGTDKKKTVHVETVRQERIHVTERKGGLTIQGKWEETPCTPCLIVNATRGGVEVVHEDGEKLPA